MDSSSKTKSTLQYSSADTNVAIAFKDNFRGDLNPNKKLFFTRFLRTIRFDDPRAHKQDFNDAKRLEIDDLHKRKVLINVAMSDISGEANIVWRRFVLTLKIFSYATRWQRCAMWLEVSRTLGNIRCHLKQQLFGLHPLKSFYHVLLTSNFAFSPETLLNCYTFNRRNILQIKCIFHKRKRAEMFLV